MGIAREREAENLFKTKATDNPGPFHSQGRLKMLEF
jgi:hypothetical protein